MSQIDIEVTETADGYTCHVTVKDARSSSDHRVTLHKDDFCRLAGNRCSPEELVRQSFLFLLEREPKESILRSFDLTIIGHYFPVYERELRRRLWARPNPRGRRIGLMPKKRALITGITGQDGSYLAEFLLEKDYEVFGMVRRSSSERMERVDHLKDQLTLIKGELTDPLSLFEVVSQVRPHELYNLGAMSFVKDSFNQPAYTVQVTGMGAVNLLEICKRILPDVRFYQASSSEMFGQVHEVPQKESTPFQPSSPYGYAKLLAHLHTIQCRREGLFAVSGILFNHESPRRGYEFVTHKVTDAVAREALGLVKDGRAPLLTLGNLDSKRDWGYAPEYVRGMWLMLQRDEPDDYVLATNHQTTVRDFVRLAFEHVGITVDFSGQGVEEKGFDRSSGRTLCQVSPEYFRPVDVVNLRGDFSKAQALLGWEPATSVEELVQIMLDHDLECVQKEVANGQIKRINN